MSIHTNVDLKFHRGDPIEGLLRNGPLYKYMKREFARRVVEQGEVFVNTLYALRKQEEVAPCRGDLDEATITDVIHIPNYTTGDPAEAHVQAAIDREFGSEALGEGTRILNYLSIQRVSAPNLYCYSFSTKYAQSVNQCFGTEYDCVVKITDPIVFFRELTLALDGKVTLEGHGKECGPIAGVGVCCYVNVRRGTETNFKLNPAFSKGPLFRHQSEGRIIWKPSDPNFVPCPLAVTSQRIGATYQLLSLP